MRIRLQGFILLCSKESVGDASALNEVGKSYLILSITVVDVSVLLV